MLENSAAVAELSLRALGTLGTQNNSMSHPFSFVELITKTQNVWTQTGSTWVNDFVPEYVQVAALTHSEMAADRFFQQFASVLDAISRQKDAHWIAVTCYYAAFYAAQALLLQTGHGAVKIPRGGLPFSGVYSLATSASPTAAGRLQLTLTPVQRSSHRQTWEQVVFLIDEILNQENDARAILVLNTLKQEIQRPKWLSDLRNEINYDLTKSPFLAMLWTSLLSRVSDRDRLEDELARSIQEKPERRFEVVAMALAEFSAQLRSEHLSRGGRIDKRQRRARKELLPDWEWLLMA